MKTSFRPKRALLVYDDERQSAPPKPGAGAGEGRAAGHRLTAAEQMIEKQLDALGFKETVPRSVREPMVSEDRAGFSLVVLLPSLDDTEHGDKFRDLPVPVLVLSGSMLTRMRMTGPVEETIYGQNQGGHDEGQGVRLKINDPAHPLAAGLNYDVRMAPRLKVKTGRTGAGALRVAAIKDTSADVLFGYESGAAMVGLNAPARRVALFFDEEHYGSMSADYWRLFRAAVVWALSEYPLQFSDVFRAERSEIEARREVHRAAQRAAQRAARRHEEGHEAEEARGGAHAGGPPPPPGAPDASPPLAPPSDIAGLALSGGGIRAATFGLGLLQALRENKVLGAFDYLSTVSGGGYVGGWWSAWLGRHPDEQHGGEDFFPPREKITPTSALLLGEMEFGGDGGSRPFGQEVAEDLLSAGTDPVHHLRLFSNYLTPRKGALSADTWRAATAVVRDMILTWAVLLPVLIVAVLLGKLYFTLQPHAYDFGSANFFISEGVSDPAALWQRLQVAAWPLEGLAGWIVVLTCVWMVADDGGDSGARMKWAGAAGGVAVVLLLALLALLVYQDPTFAGRAGASLRAFAAGWGWWLLIWGAGLACFLFYALVPRESDGGGARAGSVRPWRREVRRMRLVRAQAWLLMFAVVVAFVLALAGFGQELVNYALGPGGAARWVVRFGGWGAILTAVAGSILTAVKTSPMGGHDPREGEEMSLPSRVLLKITPLLVVVLLAVLISWLANWMLIYVADVYHLQSLTNCGDLNLLHAAASPDDFWRVTFKEFLGYFQDNEGRLYLIELLTIATGVGMVVSLLFALVETSWRRPWPQRALLGVWSLAALFVVLVFLAVGSDVLRSQAAEGVLDVDSYTSFGSWWPLAALLACCCVTAPLLCYRLTGDDERRPRWPVWGAVLCAASVALLVLLAYKVTHAFASVGGVPPKIPFWQILFIPYGLASCLAYAVLEWRLGQERNDRAAWLAAFVFVTLTAMLTLSLFADYTDVRLSTFVQSRGGATLFDIDRRTPETDALVHAFDIYVRVLLGQALLGMIGALLAWVIAMGWMADPNMLSLHAFYRSRLVRAYLGASNRRRSRSLKEITEAVEDDDLLLQSMRNCERGGPYHLVNTTLNLVGGRDLATAQRAAATFVLSKRYCGSSRVGYRDTREYMGGRLSLGTAVAISGAAASPNMGTKTLTAPVAMLMTFLNVRLGYWAPTPNKRDWRATRARLWPYYMLREFLSQTNDLSTYCYLTDGGHFDNTGLYSLVERGCRFILLADCGADPEPCFSDLGDAIRRCRIDFGAEIKLDISPFLKDGDEAGGKKDGEAKKKKTAPRNFVVGQIEYDEKHLELLGWGDDIAAKKVGKIILFKPALTPAASADVRQYGIENSDFPQQATVNQWFDEAQFESYRMLGHHCGQQAFDGVQWRPLSPRGVEEMFEAVEARAAAPAGEESASPAGRNGRGSALTLSTLFLQTVSLPGDAE